MTLNYDTLLRFRTSLFRAKIYYALHYHEYVWTINLDDQCCSALPRSLSAFEWHTLTLPRTTVRFHERTSTTISTWYSESRRTTNWLNSRRATAGNTLPLFYLSRTIPVLGCWHNLLMNLQYTHAPWHLSTHFLSIDTFVWNDLKLSTNA